MINISTVGDIRRALEGHSDDEIVHAQVVAVDGTAWDMYLSISPIFKYENRIVVSMSHPELLTLIRKA